MSHHLLVIDANVDLADDIGELLGDTGARVTVVHDAADGEDAAKSDPFDVALVDLGLHRGGRGLDQLPALRRASPEGEIIVMTGAASVHSAIEAVRQGVFGYLSKPFDPRDLMQLTDRALAQVSLRRERTALSRELARSEGMHRAVFETVDSLLVGLDPEHRIALWNRAIAESTGWSRADVQGAIACDLLFPEPHHAHIHRMLERAQAGEATAAKVPIHTREGVRRVVLWRFLPMIPDAAGTPLVLLSGKDLTERLALEERAASAEAMAAMGRLTSALAHEIRNPLNAARLQLELLKRGAVKAGSDTMARRADVVGEELGRLTTLLNDFLGLARPKHQASRGVDVIEIAARVHELHEPSAAEAGVTLRLEAEDDVPRVVADAGRLTQALINLVVNAFDATEGQEDATIAIGVRSEGDDVVLSVTDDGPGLPDATDPLLPFETTKEKGTGLGLPIVERIVQMHGGRLALGPGPGGRGTCAALWIPRGRADA